MNTNKIFAPKSLVASALIFFLFISTTFGQIHFTGFAGLAGNIGTKEGEDKVQLAADTFFAGQLDLFNIVMLRAGATVHTGNLFSDVFTNTVGAQFTLDELSVTAHFPCSHVTRYISVFAGEYESIGSDVFLRRHFGILPFASRLAENLAGTIDTNIYPFSNLGASYVLKLKTPQAFGLYFYAGERKTQQADGESQSQSPDVTEEGKSLRGNVDLRFAGVFPFITVDFSAGIGFPIEQDEGKASMSLNQRLEFHTGLSTVIGNTHTASLFLQFGITKVILNPLDDQKSISLSDLYFWIEPRFKAEFMNFHFTLFNIPKDTIQDMFYLSGSLGANLAVFANNIYAGPLTLTTGAHLTISTQNIALSEINNVSGDNISFRISPFIEIPFFEGMFTSRFSINFMEFEKMHTSIKFSLGYKTKL
ncbi:MAG: hypothetical protein J6R96_07600 [Spirochaetaceae bacterium]|nr:hypothetical protein [Spirochaetaceae bacterium]